MNRKSAHVQWFHHGYQTYMEELAHPQELFLTDLCGDVDLVCVLDKATVKKYEPGTRPRRLRANIWYYG